jgi:hypothetical protein
VSAASLRSQRTTGSLSASSNVPPSSLKAACGDGYCFEAAARTHAEHKKAVWIEVRMSLELLKTRT